MIPTLSDPIRPEVAGRLKLAERHRRIAGHLGWSRRWESSPRRLAHLSKAQKHEAAARRFLESWIAAHPQQEA